MIQLDRMSRTANSAAYKTARFAFDIRRVLLIYVEHPLTLLEV